MKTKIKKAFFIAFSLLSVSFITTTIITSCSSNNTNNKVPETENNPSASKDFFNSGSINGLFFSKYIGLFTDIKLNKDTKLSSITNNKLNESIHKNQAFSKLFLSIKENSSEKEGKLILNLNGEYDNKKINNDEITITGFNNYKTKRFEVKNFSINKEIWFNNNFPIDTKPDLQTSNNQDILFSLIDSRTNFIIDENIYSFDEIKRNFNINSIKLLKSSSSNKPYYLNIKFETKFNKYLNDKWVLDAEQDEIINNNPANNLSFSLPTFYELKKHIMNSLKFNDDYFSSYYPNYFSGKYRYFKYKIKPSVEDLFQIASNCFNLNEIVNKYSSYLSNPKSIILTVDWLWNIFEYDKNTNIFKINMILIDDNNLNDRTIVKKFETTKIKNESTLISDLIRENTKNPFKAYISPNQDNDNKYFKFFTTDSKAKEAAKKAFTTMDTTQVVNYDGNNLLPKQGNIYSWIGDNGYNNHENVNNGYLKYFKNNFSSLNLFGKNIDNIDFYANNIPSNKPAIDFSSGLIYLDPTNNVTLLADRILFQFSKNTQINFIVNSNYPQILQINFKAKLEIYSYNNEEIILPITFYMNLPKSSLGIN